jgi:hypothetical protein
VGEDAEGDIHIFYYHYYHDKLSTHLQQVRKKLLAAANAWGARHHGRAQQTAKPPFP